MYPLPQNEPARLDALYVLSVLDTPPEPHFDAVSRTASALFGVPIALVSLIDRDRQWFKARCGLDVEGTSREAAFCTYTILSDDVLVVEDATTDERFRDNPLVTGAPGIRFYAGAPLIMGPGIRVGTLCVIDTAPRSFTAEQRFQLADLAQTITALLRLNQSRAVAEAEIAARREREPFLSSVLNASSDCIKVVENDGSLTFMNANGLCAMEIECFADVRGAEWAALWPSEARSQVCAAIETAKQGSMARFEAFCPTAKGTPKWWDVTVSPVTNEDGHVTRLISISRDVTERYLSSQALARNEERLRLALEATGLGIWDIDPRTGERNWSTGLRDILGYGEDVVPARAAFLERLHPEDRARVADDPYPTLPKGGQAERLTYRIQRADNGDERWIEVTGKTLVDEAGKPIRLIGTMQDITARRQAEQALRASEERLRLALQAGRMFAWERDLSSDHVERSANARDLIGLGSGPASDFVAHVHPDDRAKAPAVTRGQWGLDAEQSELRFVRADGRMLWLAARSTLYREPGRPDRLIGVTFDISDRKAAEDRVWRAANQDPLTGLPNRALFQRRLEDALARAEADQTSVCLLLIDLDGFKDVNDTLGHDAGDALLKITAERLREFVRDCDTLARLGGDEFAVILVSPLELQHATALGKHILSRLCEPLIYEGRMISSRASIGVAASPHHHRESRELLKDADLALYRAKTEGRHRVVAYAPEMREATERRVTVAREVQEAVREGRIVPFYQPKVSFATGAIVGLEVLARWQHPTRGVLTPGYFGSVFEDSELATAIGESLVTQVAADVRSWLDRGLDCGRVAVNLSSAEFADPGLADNTLRVLRSAGVPTKHFEVEVTETVLLGRSTEEVASILRQFHEHGVKVALDDFGTGYASLTHLKRFPVNHIKVDQSFIRDLEHDRDDAAIVAAVIGLGRSLGMKVTAEGVETKGQAECLRQMGCDYAQGYFYAKPMAGSRVRWLLETWTGQGASIPSPSLAKAAIGAHIEIIDFGPDNRAVPPWA